VEGKWIERKEMKKIIISIPILALLFISCVTYGEEIFIRVPLQEPGLRKKASLPRGALLEIQAKDDEYIMGELIAVQKNVLLIQEWPTSKDLSIDIGHIKFIKFARKSKAKEGMVIGGAIGALIGRATYNEHDNSSIDLGPGFNTAAGGLIGVAAGGIIGASLDSAQTIQIEGKSHSEIKIILEYLRSKSRVHN